ncbi:MAG TPA: ABC transporter permease, partial [Thermoanaerobaculia bacterium]
MSLTSDIRHALRGWRSSPGFTLVALATLAIGIGATTAIWSVVYGVLLRPLPFPDAQRVVMAGHSYRSGEFEASISAASFLFVREQGRAFERLAGVTGWDPSVMLGDEPQRISGARVSADYFPTLGVRPLIGRDFQAGEDERGRDGVVILSEALWNRSFGRDPGVI